jgi:hypothetical protein
MRLNTKNARTGHPQFRFGKGKLKDRDTRPPALQKKSLIVAQILDGSALYQLYAQNPEDSGRNSRIDATADPSRSRRRTRSTKGVHMSIYGLATPTMPVASETDQPVPKYALYDTTAITIAAVLGGPIPATMLMAQNYRRMGKMESAFAALAAGVGVTLAVALLASWIPNGAGMGIPVALCFGVRRAAESLQGPAVDSHVNAGGKLGSKWAAAGLGLTFLALVCLLMFAPR